MKPWEHALDHYAEIVLWHRNPLNIARVLNNLRLRNELLGDSAMVKASETVIGIHLAMLDEADIYFWDHERTDLVWQMSQQLTEEFTLQPGAVEQVIAPSAPAYWYFERPIHVPFANHDLRIGAVTLSGDSRIGLVFSVFPPAGVFWEDDSGHNTKTVVGNIIQLNVPLTRHFEYGGQGYDDPESIEATYTFSRFLCACLLFTQERVYTHTNEPASRDIRRRLESKKVGYDRGVNVIVLRRKYQSRTDESRNVEWSMQWPVRGHWRHLKDGRSIPIPAYVKGPKDKPFKGDSGKLLYKVVR
jgi:hypothetical protein